MNSPIQQAITDLQQGKMIILQDDQNRENEGDLVMSAEKITPEAINFMCRLGRGLICMPMEEKDFKRLGISMMTAHNESKFQTGFGVSIGAATGITTGISAQDRARTIQVAANPQSTEKEIVKPGHVFPLKAREGGVFVRRGQTEGSVDLMKCAGLRPMAVICEIMNEDGTMARDHDLKIFSEKYSTTRITIEDIVQHRLQTETFVEKISTAKLPTQYDTHMQIHFFKHQYDQSEWIAVTSGDIEKNRTPLVRLHSQCLTGDVFRSVRCDCGEQLEIAFQKIAEKGGILLYMPQEGRGIGLQNKIKAYALQDQGMDTVQANHQLGFLDDERDYIFPAQILRYLGVDCIRLLTNNPRKMDALTKYGVTVKERIPLMTVPKRENARYLKTKKEKLGHLLSVE